MERIYKSAGYIINKFSQNLFILSIQVLLSFVLIPFSTYVLKPSDFGVFALAIVFQGFLVAFTESGSIYVLYGEYPNLKINSRKRLLSTLFLWALFLGLVMSISTLIIWPFLEKIIPLISDLNSTEKFLLCISIPLSTAYSIVNPMLIIQQKSFILSLASFLKTIVNTFTVIFCLYKINILRESLFWGHFLGVLIPLLFAIYFLKDYLFSKPHFYWIRQVKKVMLAAWLSTSLENIKGMIENSLTAKYLGSTILGNFAHSKIYQGLLMQCSNAMAYVLWPISLKEAKENKREFKTIKNSWILIHVFFLFTAIGSIFFGNEVINLLTHGKFIHASKWIPWLIIYVLIQASAKPATAILHSNKKGNIYSRIRIFCLISSIIAMFFVLPIFGISGLISISIIEIIVFKILTYFYSSRDKKVPFQDQWVLASIIVVPFFWFIEKNLYFSIYIEFTILIITALIFISILILQNKEFIKDRLNLKNIFK